MIFSIIMPVYNVEQYLTEAIESVLNQKFTDFELIIVNDGSTDNSLKIAEKLKEQDPRIHIITQENKGLSSARNTGLSVAKGEYIYFIDSDDRIIDITLSSIFERIQHKAYDMVCFLAEPFITKFKTHDENEKILKQYNNHYERAYLIEKEYSEKEYQEEMCQNNNFVPSACLYVFKKSLVINNNIQFFEGILFEDNLFTRELLSYSKNVYFISKKLYQRRIRHGSITTSKIDERKPYSFLMISEQLFNLYQLKKENKYLRDDSIYFFRQAFHLIKKQFNYSKELKLKLYKVNKKIKLKEFKYEIIQMKYPLLRSSLLLWKRIKNKINRILKN